MRQTLLLTLFFTLLCSHVVPLKDVVCGVKRDFSSLFQSEYLLIPYTAVPLSRTSFLFIEA